MSNIVSRPSLSVFQVVVDVGTNCDNASVPEAFIQIPQFHSNHQQTYLSTYMGHVSLEETLYYIHLLPERLKSSPGIDWKMLNDIYQTEEGSDEED